MFVLLTRVFVAIAGSAILSTVTGVGLELDVVPSSGTTQVVVASGGHGWIGSPQP